MMPFNDADTSINEETAVSKTLIRVHNATRDTELGHQVERATTFMQRGRGLMFRGRLPDGGGMLIDPCSSVHMFWMRFPLDVVYVSKAHEVVRVQTGLRPWRIGPLVTRGARYVVELPVGAIARSDTQVGDRLTITPVDASGGSRSGQPA